MEKKNKTQESEVNSQSIRAIEEEFNSILEGAIKAERELTEEETKKVEELKVEKDKLTEELEETKDIPAEEETPTEEEKPEAEEPKNIPTNEENSDKTEEETKKEELEDKLEDTNVEHNKRSLDDNININIKVKMENKLIEAIRERIDTDNRSAVLAQRAPIDGDTGAMTNAIPNYVEALDILGYEPLYTQMNAKVLSGAKGTFTLPYESPMVADLIAELATLTGDTTTPDGILVQPHRFSVQKAFTLETLNSATDEFLQSVLADMVKAADRGITKEVYTKALGYASVVAGTDISKAGFDALMAGAEVEVDGAFFASRPTFFEAKGVAIDSGSGRFLVERLGASSAEAGFTYDGVPFWYSNLYSMLYTETLQKSLSLTTVK